MSRRILTPKAIATILSIVALSHTVGCSKAVIENNAEAHPQMSRAAAERVVEIDRQLSAPLTGTPEDSDRRATLRAERVALTGTADPAQIVRAHVPVAREVTSPRNTQIVVARDSRVTHEPHRLSGVEAMTPTERKRYYEELRLRNTHVVVPVVVERRY